MWDDAKIGVKYPSAWEPIAVVSDIEWVRTGINVFAHAIWGMRASSTTASLPRRNGGSANNSPGSVSYPDAGLPNNKPRDTRLLGPGFLAFNCQRSSSGATPCATPPAQLSSVTLPPRETGPFHPPSAAWRTNAAEIDRAVEHGGLIRTGLCDQVGQTRSLP